MFNNIYSFEETQNLIKNIIYEYLDLIKTIKKDDDFIEDLKKEISNKILQKIENFKIIYEIHLYEKKIYKVNKYFITHWDNELDGNFKIQKDYDNKLLIIEFFVISF